MSNKKFFHENLQTKLSLDKAASHIYERLSIGDFQQLRNIITHTIQPKITTVSKIEKSVKELEYDLFKGWQSSNAEGSWEELNLILNPTQSGQKLKKIQRTLLKFEPENTELKTNLESLNEIYGRLTDYQESPESFSYELREAYDAKTDYFSFEELYTAYAKVEFKDYVETFLSKLRVEIRILWRAVTQFVQIDKRTNFRNMIQFLFKNLDDAHSYLNNSLIFFSNYLNITQHETRKYTRVN